MRHILLIIAFLISLYVANVLPLLPESAGVQMTVVESEHIVSFQQYFSQQRRSEILTEALHDLNENFTWRQIPRKNPGQALPSDFSVLQFSNGERNESYQLLIDRLRSHSQIRSVSPQKRFTRKNLNFAQRSLQQDPRLLCGGGHDSFVENLTDSFYSPGASENISPYTGRRQLGLYSPYRSSFQERRGSQRFALGRRLMRVIPTQLTSAVDANVLWSRGVTGKGVKVAIFDTGLGEKHPHFRNIVERTDWTDEGRPSDELGHGTFVAGVIASHSPECQGLAPDAELYVFRVFTDSQVSYTSWFLDAFNYAIHSKITVLNLSIGGPDFLDQPFVDKVWELTANNVILVSAIGNDGPLYGTLNNPADQMDVIGVGGIDFEDRIAPFSSRGMTTWELPGGYGRLKPDLVAYGSSVRASGISGGCKTLSGTSVSSPVVAGAVALLVSAVRAELVNPASVKQVLIQSAKRVPRANMFEQGHGKLDLLHAYQLLSQYRPHASLSPAYLDSTECPYMWPYCSQPLFHSSMPLTVNVTVLNGMGVVGHFAMKPIWQPFSAHNADKLDVSISYSPKIWPWSGWMGVRIRVSKPVEQEMVVKGQISAVISSPKNSQSTPEDWDHDHSMDTVSSRVVFPITIRIVPTPPREMRVLWDQFHNLRYPGGYFPRDSLFPMIQSHQKGPHSQDDNTHDEHGPTSQQQPLDWHADHVHTNFRELWLHLRSLDYYIDVLGEPYTCFDAENYGTLMIVDPEDEFFPEEIEKLSLDLTQRGLNLIVLAEWYNVKVMDRIKFFDENTQQWWTPVTGGSNIPALNDLLFPFGLGFSDEIFAGTYTLPGVTLNGETRARDFPYLSGTALARFPPDARILSVSLHDQVAEVTQDTVKEVPNVPILALVEGTSLKSGRLLAYGDSSCFDSTDFHPECLWLIKRMLDYTRGDNVTDLVPPPHDSSGVPLPPRTFDLPLPVRSPESDLHLYSKILSPVNPGLKRKLTSCSQLIWNRPRPIQHPGEYILGTGREIQEYLLEREEKLAVGIILSSEVDKNYKLPFIFPICLVVIFALVYWLYFRKQSRRIKYRIPSPRPPTNLPLV